VLSYLFEEIYPKLRPGFEFDILSGTSVGAIHSAYVAASAHLDGTSRSQRLVDTWRPMEARHIFQFSIADLVRIPLRVLGLSRPARRPGTRTEVLGGLLNIAPLERIVEKRIPWAHLRDNLARSRAGTLCISCTEVGSGRVAVFMDGRLADTTPWAYDPNATALVQNITARHVRASAAIPFLFPAIRIGDRYYVDGGLRMNTPLSPAVRLASQRVLVVALKHARPANGAHPPCSQEAITHPAFLLGKVLDAMLLDQLEYELQRLDLVNALIERGEEVYGAEFLDKINVAVREQRGVSYRRIQTRVIRPSQDIGVLAAECYRREGRSQTLGVLPLLLSKLVGLGAVQDEADLLSYLFFDGCFTTKLVELGREDARAQRDSILELLAD
jgi:NTE family protein